MNGVETASRFSHRLLLHGSDQELLRTVVPFLQAGIRAGEGVVVCCRPPTTGLVRRTLGPAHPVVYLDYGETYTTPIGAIAAFQGLVDEYLSAGTNRVRVLAEAVYDRTPQERLEWARYEAVANRAMGPYPVSAICLYDTRLVPTDLLALGRRTHPTLVTRNRCTTNPEFVQPADFLQQTTQSTPDPVEAEPPDLEVTKIDDFDELRTQLELCLFQTTHMAHEAADMVLAANEAATNARRHGRPPVTVRLWVRPDRCVCTVTDHGPGIHDPFAGYIWPGTLSTLPTNGMGLWLARRLCDHVHIVNNTDGCTIRLIVQRGHTTPHTAHH